MSQRIVNLLNGVNRYLNDVKARLSVIQDRAHHTGEQPISSITGLAAALLGLKDRASHTGVQPISSVTDLETRLTALKDRSTHTGTQPISSITNLETRLQANNDLSTHTGNLPMARVEGLIEELKVHGHVFSLTNNQIIPQGVLSKVNLNADYASPSHWLNFSNSRIIVDRPGLYEVAVTINYQLNFTAGGAKANIHAYSAHIRRNGNEILKKGSASGYFDTHNTVLISYVALLNGTTDYLELFTQVDGPDINSIALLSGRTETTFSIRRLGDYTP